MKMLWVFLGIFLGCTTSYAPQNVRKYSNFNEKCDVSRLSFDGEKEQCYCKIVGLNGQTNVIIFVPIPQRNCL